jgi:hypothetical protein
MSATIDDDTEDVMNIVFSDDSTVHLELYMPSNDYAQIEGGTTDLSLNNDDLGIIQEELYRFSEDELGVKRPSNSVLVEHKIIGHKDDLKAIADYAKMLYNKRKSIES